jgi:hypothetical protein
MGSMRGRWWVIGLGLAVFCLISNGCSRKTAKPGVTYDVSVIAQGSDGRPSSPGPATRVESAVVQDVREVTHQGSTVSVMVRKTEYGRATFDVTFAGKATQMVRVKKGETKDVLPDGQTVGVRIAVHDCH